MKSRTNLSNAFAQLRKQGYVAKQNFLCCQSCGWAALSEEEAKLAVFYHSQDAQGLRKGDDLHLCWAGNGEEIVDVLKNYGLDVEWEGTTNRRIMVKNQSII
jgi:hypothetical protein